MQRGFNALQQFPNDQELSEAYIKALSKTGREKDLISFTEVILPSTLKKEQREILETLSWGVIENATSSSAPLIRIYALLAAFYANDAKGVQIIQKVYKTAFPFKKRSYSVIIRTS